MGVVLDVVVEVVVEVEVVQVEVNESVGGAKV